MCVGYHALPHHGAHSGYSQLEAALDRRMEVVHLDETLPSRFSEQLADAIARRAGVTWYARRSVGLELAAARALIAGELVHLLYAEAGFAHLGRISAPARRRGGRLVATFHQPPAQIEAVHGDPVARDRRLRGLDAVIALSGATATWLCERVEPGRVHVVLAGVDAEFFGPEPAPGRAGDGAGPLRIACVGSWLRDSTTLATALAILAADGSGIEVDLVGAPPDDALRAVTGVRVRERLSDTELRDVYRRADVAVVALTDASANTALLEGMACGAATVVTDVGGVRDYADEDCAVLVAPRDPGALAGAIRALAGDPERRRRLGAGARRRALELTWDLAAARTLEVYAAVR